METQAAPSVLDFAVYRAASDGERAAMRAAFQGKLEVQQSEGSQPHEKIAALAREARALAVSLAQGAINPRAAAAVADLMAKDIGGCCIEVIRVLDTLALEKDKRRKWKRRAKRRG